MRIICQPVFKGQLMSVYVGRVACKFECACFLWQQSITMLFINVLWEVFSEFLWSIWALSDQSKRNVRAELLCLQSISCFCFHANSGIVVMLFLRTHLYQWAGWDCEVDAQIYMSILVWSKRSHWFGSWDGLGAHKWDSLWRNPTGSSTCTLCALDPTLNIRVQPTVNYTLGNVWAKG